MASVVVTETSSGGGSKRWCPTPEQVMLLNGMYKGGLRNPTTNQIQQITTRLSIYGKVQGKNVFYWFQNHKARERHKLRKKLNAFYHQHHHHQPYDQPFLPLHQVGGVDGASSSRTIVNNSKVDFPSDQTCCLMQDCHLMSMMMMSHHGATPYETRVPPKTLQLFPVTTTTNTTADLKGVDGQ